MRILEFKYYDVCVGTPEFHGVDDDGNTIESSYRKMPVESNWVNLGELGFEGNYQAERGSFAGNPLHIGPERAVYAMTTVELECWKARAGVPITQFGQNLTLVAPENYKPSMVHLDDRFQVFGLDDDGNEFELSEEVLLEVSQTRRPCDNSNIQGSKYGITKLAEQMFEHGDSGFLMRVVKPGRVPTKGVLKRIKSDSGRPNLVVAHRQSIEHFSHVPKAADKLHNLYDPVDHWPQPRP